MKKNQQSLLKVAHVSKAHGLKGEIFIRPLNIRTEWPRPLKEIIIGTTVFSVQNYSLHKEGMIFKLDNCQTKREAEALKSQAVFLPKKLFKSRKGEGIYLAELLSFCVELLDQVPIGTVHSFQSNSFQDFLLVQPKGEQKLIPVPFVKTYIRKIHFSEKKIILNLPPDFLDNFS